MTGKISIEPDALDPKFAGRRDVVEPTASDVHPIIARNA